MKALCVGISAVILAFCGSALAAQATWDEQLDEMGYHILHLSGLNAINGLNLSREQVLQLRALARKVVEAGGKVPPMNRDLGEGFAGVREAYNDLSKVLIQDKEVPPALKARVAKARDRETRTIRASLRPDRQPGPAEQCNRCHVQPSAVNAAGSERTTEAAYLPGKRLSVEDEKSAGLAHSGISITGKKGMRMIAQLTPQVDAILSDGQKEIMQDFACCILPPAELSNPVRAGQVEAPEAMMNLLRKARATPESSWPAGRSLVLSQLKRGDVLRSPGLKTEELAAREAKRADLLDRVRKMSDAEFEMNKESLCAELKMKKTFQPSTEQGQNFKAARFLLMPGTVEVYDALLKRPECR